MIKLDLNKDKNIELDNVIILPLSDKTADDAADILREAFPWCYDGKNADKKIKRMLSKRRISLVALLKTDISQQVAGVISAIPQYGITGWELDPLAVLKEYQGLGIGKLLVKILEDEVVKRGGVMIYLGSDDEHGTTTLYGVDLFEDTFEKIKNIECKGHPFPFYEKMGYKIVGVFPDANGIGKPDIWMAKRLKKI